MSIVRWFVPLFFGCLIFMGNVASAQQPNLRMSRYGEVLVDGGNPVTDPTKSLKNLSDAISKNKKANFFRITWSYTSGRDLWGSGSAVYSRDERILKYHVVFNDLKRKPIRENFLFTKVTDDILHRLEKQSRERKEEEDESKQSTLFWRLISFGCNRYELKEGTKFR